MTAKKTTIIWLHSHFLYWMGGTKFVFEVTKRLSEKKTKIEIMVENVGEVAQQQFAKTDVSVVSLQSLTSTSPWYWLFLPWFLWQDVRVVRHLISVARQRGNDVKVVASMFPMNVVAALTQVSYAQLCYEPFAFFYDAEFIRSFSIAKRLFIDGIKLPYQFLDKWATQQARTVMTLNGVTRELIHEVYGIDAQLVYAGVDLKRFQPHVNKELQQKYRGRKVVIHSTDYSPVKGTDRVIAAFQHVVQKVPTAVLLITTTIKNSAAEMKLRAQATQLKIEKNVEFVGFLPIEELPQYYSLAWVLVQGSSSARSGTTSMALPVKEAMACGTPAIRPDVGGEDVVDGVSGFLVDPRNTKLLAKKIIAILQKPSLRQKMGRAARTSIIKKYTWEQTTARIVRAIFERDERGVI